MGLSTCYCALCGKAPANETGRSSDSSDSSELHSALGRLRADSLPSLHAGMLGMLGFSPDSMRALVEGQIRDSFAKKRRADAKTGEREATARLGEWGDWLDEIVVWEEDGCVTETSHREQYTGYGAYSTDNGEIEVTDYDDKNAVLCHARCFECLSEVAKEAGVNLRFRSKKDEPPPAVTTSAPTKRTATPATWACAQPSGSGSVP